MKGSRRETKIGRRLAWLGAAAMLALGALPGIVRAQEGYPNKPIRLVVGFPPGGGIDLAARVFGAKLQESMSVSVLVENRPGATGLIAAELAAKVAPDGYTLLVGAAGQMTINPVLFAKLPYDPLKDFVPIATLTVFPMLIAVNPSVPVKSLRELIALVKSQPGKFNYSHGGAAHQIAGEMLNQAAGMDMRNVPYKGGAPAVNAAIAGDVPVTVVDSPAAMTQIRACRLRALAVTTAQRSPLIPDLPTIAESGFPDYQISIWSGLFAPAGTPSGIVARLFKEVVGAAKSPDVLDKLRSMGVDPGGMAPEQLGALMSSEIAKFRAIVKSANIKAQ